MAVAPDDNHRACLRQAGTGFKNHVTAQTVAVFVPCRNPENTPGHQFFYCMADVPLVPCIAYTGA